MKLFYCSRSKLFLYNSHRFIFAQGEVTPNNSGEEESSVETPPPADQGVQDEEARVREYNAALERGLANWETRYLDPLLEDASSFDIPIPDGLRGHEGDVVAAGELERLVNGHRELAKRVINNYKQEAGRDSPEVVNMEFRPESRYDRTRIASYYGLSADAKWPDIENKQQLAARGRMGQTRPS